MPESAITDRNDEFSAHHPALDSRHFYSIENIEAECQANGGSVEYRQLQAGQNTTSIALRKCADITLLDMSTSLQIEVVGKTIESYITVFIPVGGAKYWINGETITTESILLFDACTEFYITCSENSRILSMLVPSSLLQEVGRDIFDHWQATARIRSGSVEPGVELSQRLRSLVHTAIHQQNGERRQIAQASQLTITLGAIIAKHAGILKKHNRTSAKRSLHTLKYAREYIEAHYADTISVSRICAHSAASLSKLERTFRRELNMSPTEYVLIRRLAAVNLELKKASSSGKQIAQIAMDCGFNHLGRFSAKYCSYFGELPSATLRSNQREVGPSSQVLFR